MEYWGTPGQCIQVSGIIPVFFLLVVLTSFCPPTLQTIWLCTIWRFGRFKYGKTDKRRQSYSRSRFFDNLLDFTTNPITVCFWGLWYPPGCSAVGQNWWWSQICQSFDGETDVIFWPSFQLTSPSSTVTSGILQPSAMGLKVREIFIINTRLIHEFFTGFSQKRRPDGAFVYTNPIDCSPQDNNSSRECSLQGDNEVGFYESSSWEYSWYVIVCI